MDAVAVVAALVLVEYLVIVWLTGQARGRYEVGVTVAEGVTTACTGSFCPGPISGMTRGSMSIFQSPGGELDSVTALAGALPEFSTISVTGVALPASASPDRRPSSVVMRSFGAPLICSAMRALACAPSAAALTTSGYSPPATLPGG